MKSLKTLFIIAITTLVVSCSSESPKEPTFEDKAAQSIAAYLKIDSVSNFQILDTVSTARLDSMKLTFERVALTTDSQLVRLPKLIEDTKERLAAAQKNLDEATDRVFSVGYQSIVDGETKNLASFEETLSKVQDLKKRNDAGLEFIEKAQKKVSGDIAYFLVQAQNGEFLQRFAITSSLEVLKNFSEE